MAGRDPAATGTIVGPALATTPAHPGESGGTAPTEGQIWPRGNP